MGKRDQKVDRELSLTDLEEWAYMVGRVTGSGVVHRLWMVSNIYVRI
jgi:hypothetical protein